MMGKYHQSPPCMWTKSLQSCLTSCNPMDHNPPGSSVHGSLQARILSELLCPPAGVFSAQGLNPHLLGLLHWQAVFARAPREAGHNKTVKPAQKSVTISIYLLSYPVGWWISSWAPRISHPPPGTRADSASSSAGEDRQAGGKPQSTGTLRGSGHSVSASVPPDERNAQGYVGRGRAGCKRLP